MHGQVTINNTGLSGSSGVTATEGMPISGGTNFDALWSDQTDGRWKVNNHNHGPTHLAVWPCGGTQGGIVYAGPVVGTYSIFTETCTPVGSTGSFLLGGTTPSWSTHATDNGTTLTYTGSGGISLTGSGSDLSILQGGISASTPFLFHTAIWNTVGTTYTNLLSNITNNASASGSKLFDFQVGGTSEFVLARNTSSSQDTLTIGTSVSPNSVAGKITLSGSTGGTCSLTANAGGNQLTSSCTTVLASAAQVGTTITKYNGISTISNGIAAEYVTIDLTTQGAAIAATTLYAVPATANGMYRVCYVATVTRAATTSSTLGGSGGFQLKYTDQDDSVVKTLPGVVVVGVDTNNTNLTTTGTLSGCYVVSAAASSNIQYQMGYTSSGGTTMQYNLHIKLEAL